MFAGDSLEATYDTHFPLVNSRSPNQTLVKCFRSTVGELTSWEILREDPQVITRLINDFLAYLNDSSALPSEEKNGLSQHFHISYQVLIVVYSRLFGDTNHEKHLHSTFSYNQPIMQQAWKPDCIPPKILASKVFSFFILNFWNLNVELFGLILLH